MNTDLKDLFKWNTEVEIKNKAGEVLTKLFVRLIGDVDYHQAQQHALLASRKLRKALKDPKTAEHQALCFDLDEREKTDLVFSILLAEVANFRELAMADLGDAFFDEELPSDASLEDREQQQEAEEKFAKEKSDKLKAKMEEKSEIRKKELEKMSMKDLRKIFVESSINYKCLDEFTNVFREYSTFAGTFSDKNFKKPAFESFDIFRNAAPNLKRQIMDAYLKLELTGDQLKN